MEKRIFILWLQGWKNAPWLQKKVLESWEINNKFWKIELLDIKNISSYVNDIDYIFDKNKKISYQAISDIIRLSILKNYGGVWADSTLLCMQPLDHWAHEAIQKSGFWMYHGHGYELDSNLGPASWFILSEKNNYNISRWKEKCDFYWKKNNYSSDYFWMDRLFKELIEKDKIFKKNWIKTPFLYCEENGSSHTLANYNFKMEKDSKLVKDILKNKPPYVLKLGSNFSKIFPDLNSSKFKNSNAFCAIELSRRNFVFKHIYSKPFSLKSPLKKKSYFIRLIKKFIKEVLKKISKFNNK